MFRSISIGSLLALATACSSIGGDSGVDSEPANPEGTAKVEVGLQRLRSCTDLNDLLREKARAEMNAQLDEAAESIKTSDSSGCVVYSDGTPSSVSVGGSSSGSAGATPASVSETNNQVAGVDEADLVKTDGQYLYLTQGSELRIVRAWPAADTALVSRVAVGGKAKKLFVVGDRALVYVSVPRSTATDNYEWMGSQSSDCTYGYSCDFSGDGSATQILVFDVSDRAAPQLRRTIDMPGSLIAARRIGNAVHTVASVGDLRVPNLESHPNAYCRGPLTGEELTTELVALEAMRARNNAVIDSATFDIGTLATEGDQVIGSLDCSDFYRELTTDGVAITTVLSLNMVEDGPPTLANVISRAGAVYASDASLYMAVPHRDSVDSYWYGATGANEASTVHRFSIGSDIKSTAYLASGVVPGHVLNQFSMDEYNGALRIATSKGMVPDPDVESALTVLKQDGAKLVTVGSVGGIAPGEDIRSVRFQGERGYVVTFKKTDPLFVLDLKDPAAPSLVGELKIPGFSTYMHPLKDNYLLALGYEADDQGEFAYFNGIQLQIFDVTKPTEPTLLHKQVYGTRGSSSSALTDHLGFTFLPDRGLLTLPMSICDGGGNGQYGTLSFSGVVAMDVSLASGFTELGRLEEPYPTAYTAFQYGGACADWWTDSSSVVQRTVVMDDFLYAVSDNRVRVQNLTALGADVKVVDFPQ